MSYPVHILQQLALFAFAIGFTPIFASNIAPDYQKLIYYFDQVTDISQAYSEAVSRFSIDYQQYLSSRHSIRAGKAYPRLDFVEYPQSNLSIDAIRAMPLFPDTSTQVVFRELLYLYEAGMEEFTISRRWLSTHTQHYVYSLAEADSACVALDAQLRHLQMIHGELRHLLIQVRSEAIEQVLKTAHNGKELIQMKRELISIHHLVAALNRMQSGKTQAAEAALADVLHLVQMRQAQHPDLSLNPVFMSHDYLLSAAFIPLTEQLLASCQAKDYAYLNLYFRYDLEGIFEAYRALTDQFSYQAAEWEPYFQDIEEPTTWYSEN